MMIFKKAIPRRTFLKGAGAALGLPLLDAMTPAFAGPSAKPPVRLGVFYTPNGMWPMDKWTPKAEGASFEMSPTLAPLTPFRDRLVVLSGLCDGLAQHEVGGDHAWACASYLTGVRPKRTAGKDLGAGISMDQIAAQNLGQHTQLGSLEVSMIPTPIIGTCEPGYSCVYLSTISWRNPTMPLPMEHQPRAVFERLFGDSEATDPAQRLARMEKDRSILDWVVKDVSRFVTGLGPSDRTKMTEYLDAIRDVERRIQAAEEKSSFEMPKLELPSGVPSSLEEYNKLMCDLQVLAYQSDLTRVISFMVAREGPYGSRTYPEIGIADQHHALSHHQGNADKIAKLAQINLYHAKLFSYFLEKLRSTADGDGSLLDHSVILYGSSLSEGNLHSHLNLPVLLAGGGGGKIKGGRHIRYPGDTPISNLYLTILDTLGIPVENFGNSTGKLELLSIN